MANFTIPGMGDMNFGQVEQFLQGMHFPISKDDLLHEAEDKGVDDALLSQLKNLKGTHFDSVQDVMQALRK